MYTVDEASGEITLTILVRGVASLCEKRDWMVQLSTHDVSAHCKNITKAYNYIVS